MNREYNDKMSELRFTDEQKREMTDRLMAAQHKGRVRRPLPRLAAVGVAAALVLSIGAGAAVVYNKLASESFAGVFGTAHTEIVDKIGRPVGASATDNGVTVTADAIIGDKYHYAITYTIAKEDGTAFDFDASKIVGTNLLPLRFREEHTDIGFTTGGAHGCSYFYDADPTDHAIQYVEMMEHTDKLKSGGTAKAKFQDLYYSNGGEEKLLAEGKWSFRFAFDFEDTSAALLSGQSFALNGMTATIDEITLSPVALRVAYTVDSEVKWEDAPSGRESDYNRTQSERYFGSVPIVLTKTDGTTLDLLDAGGSISPENGKTVCTKGRMFDEIIPLNEVASLTIGGIEIPLS